MKERVSSLMLLALVCVSHPFHEGRPEAHGFGQQNLARNQDHSALAFLKNNLNLFVANDVGFPCAEEI